MAAKAKTKKCFRAEARLCSSFSGAFASSTAAISSSRVEALPQCFPTTILHRSMQRWWSCSGHEYLGQIVFVINARYILLLHRWSIACMEHNNNTRVSSLLAEIRFWLLIQSYSWPTDRQSVVSLFEYFGKGPGVEEWGGEGSSKQNWVNKHCTAAGMMMRAAKNVVTDA